MAVQKKYTPRNLLWPACLRSVMLGYRSRESKKENIYWRMRAVEIDLTNIDLQSIDNILSSHADVRERYGAGAMELVNK